MKAKVLFSTLVMSLCISLSANVKPGPINAAYKASASSFVAGADWMPYPKYSDREGWKALMTKDEREYFIKRGETALKHEFQPIPISTFLCLYTTGDKQAMRRIERANREAFIDLMMAELAEGKGRFMLKIADGLWFYGTSYHWSHSNQCKEHLPRHDDEKVALGNVRLGITIPLAYHFFKNEIDKMDKSICKTIEDAVQRIIIAPYLNEKNDGEGGHWWTGFDGAKLNNWNPWCNHGVAYAALLMVKDQATLDAVLDKTSRSVDSYFAQLTDDGCCDEGLYWSQAIPRFIQYLELLEVASGGKCTIRPNVKLEAISNYPSRVFIGTDNSGNNWAVNFGDSSPTMGGDPYLNWGVARYTGSQEMKDYTIYRLYNPEKGKYKAPYPKSDEGARALEFLYYYPEIRKAVNELNARIKEGASGEEIQKELRKSCPSYTFYKDVLQMTARTDNGWKIGSRFGYPGIQHGHNDIGEVILFVDNNPVLIDVGVATYTADTFGPNRFKLWSMRSDWHNCPSPNSVLQHQGWDYGSKDCTCTENNGVITFSSDMANCYVREGKVESYKRVIELNDAEQTYLKITDTFSLSERIAPDLEYFVTPGKVQKLSDTSLLINSAGTEMILEWSDNLSVKIEEAEIPEASLKKKWKNGLRRIVLSSTANAPLKGTYEMKFHKK